MKKSIIVILTLVLVLMASTLVANAEEAVFTTAAPVETTGEAVEEPAADSTSAKAIAAAITVAVAATAGAIAMGMAICKAVDGIARQPEADGKIRTSLMLGLVFVETAIIYALIVAILIIFVL